MGEEFHMPSRLHLEAAWKDTRKTVKAQKDPGEHMSTAKGSPHQLEHESVQLQGLFFSVE